MVNRDAFSSFHPLVNFLFFGLVVAFPMFVMHPVIIVCSFVAAFAYALYLDKKTLSFFFRFLLPMMIATAVINPAFSHAGVTILSYLPSGNPLTLESIIYGVFSAVLLGTVMLWFRCYTAVMTTDKFVYMFGKIMPSLSLVLSMTLRFVPKFKAQLDIVKEAQYCIGRDTAHGSIFRRIRNAVAVVSIMITWSLENAIETADSMKSRGYGLKGRTAFSIYRFDERDRSALAWLIFCGIFITCGMLANGLKWRYFPLFKFAWSEPLSLAFLAVHFLMCITPIIINRKEDKIWRSLN